MVSVSPNALNVEECSCASFTRKVVIFHSQVHECSGIIAAPKGMLVLQFYCCVCDLQVNAAQVFS